MKVDFSKFDKRLFEKYMHRNETVDFYHYGYKFHHDDSTIYYLALLKEKKVTQGGLVFTHNSEVVQDRELAIEVAKDMLLYNKAILDGNDAITDMKSRPYQKLKPLITSLQWIREEATDIDVKQSFSNVIHAFEKIIESRDFANSIYDEMKVIDDHVNKKTGFVTNEMVNEMRSLVLKFNQKMYDEAKTQLQFWDDHEVVLREIDKRKFPMSKWLEIRNLKKQLALKHTGRGKQMLLESLEVMEKNYDNNVITETRGTLTLEEYTALIQENERLDMEENGITKVRN
ncbi:MULTISPECIES: hypothetical protein [Sutcliffiella]|uniref:Uncharacterized protein n=1 Tax=Sutcliffiella cohnii TaxID=33932 RepID=A0A223KXI9_9BACI|nr:MULTISPECIES: hypothetical protein [Sutcliffiella]AST94172.1 hypothetical protein BC6307_24510 [Sutcliffiella cohnii]MED4017646.1 hypothetical protein [Sutcliffiella cohnii]WBL15389.1 hypothetical protein O1A01_01630 [Sutcliffiella sp. NC1]